MKTSNRKKLIATSSNQGVLASEKEALLKVLIRKLIKQLESPTSHKVLLETGEVINEVIFESDIDGVHYCLVRCSEAASPNAQPQQTDCCDILPNSDTTDQNQEPEKINLSPREIAIAKLVAQGLPNKSIGTYLDISPWTVATHLKRIFVKLGVSSRTAMVARLVEIGE
ncbi:MAG: helix-turn-helix transcriptional regulator [Calothrix sp. SM1_7_51]|nr:helix-turn-helix transcriptional regulator [Calothrix sp. SM1_7_51]